MTLSLFCLAASCLAAAGTDPGVPQPLPIGPTQVITAPQVPAGQPAPMPGNFTTTPVYQNVPATGKNDVIYSPTVPPEEKPSMWSRWHQRLGNLWHRSPQGTTTPIQPEPVLSQPRPSTPAPPLNPGQARKTPAASGNIVPASYHPEIGKEVPEVTKQFRDKVGHEEDYSWITGQLYHINVDSGVWVVRYATIETIDKYGGTMILAPTIDMRNAHEGDLISIRGELVKDGRVNQKLGGAVYRVTAIDIIEHGNKPPQ